MLSYSQVPSQAGCPQSMTLVERKERQRFGCRFPFAGYCIRDVSCGSENAGSCPAHLVTLNIKFAGVGARQSRL